MRWSRVRVEAITYELPEIRMGSAELEGRLAPLYQRLRLPAGQVERLTGVRERRFWPPGPSMGACAARAARKALDSAGVDASDIGVIIYAGVCRENLEPATACVVAAELGIGGETVVLDHVNACLGVLNGMVTVANMIELGQVRAGLVVSTESAREIADTTVERILREGTLDTWRQCLPSLTGGSGSVAVLLTAADFSDDGHVLEGGVALAAPEHHRLARWGSREGLLGQSTWVMETDAPGILEHGVELGLRSWHRFLETMAWSAGDVDRAIMHQVGSAHQRAILQALSLPLDCTFSTVETLGNVGSAALAVTAAIAGEEGCLQRGDRVGFLGIGTGLNVIMLGLQWSR